jgi:hypothetical protein
LAIIPAAPIAGSAVPGLVVDLRVRSIDAGQGRSIEREESLRQHARWMGMPAAAMPVVEAGGTECKVLWRIPAAALVVRGEGRDGRTRTNKPVLWHFDVLCDLVGGQNGPKKSVDENFGRNLSSFIIMYR